nr:MAG TPA: hypothetical protein [Caudoviricetes sp.]
MRFMKNSFRWCAALAALCLCDGYMIPQVLAIHNIGMLHKFEGADLCKLYIACNTGMAYTIKNEVGR